MREKLSLGQPDIVGKIGDEVGRFVRDEGGIFVVAHLMGTMLLLLGAGLTIKGWVHFCSLVPQFLTENPPVSFTDGWIDQKVLQSGRETWGGYCIRSDWFCPVANGKR
jgi:hypothetical protein